MPKILEILAVAGFRIKVGDDSPYWKLIAAVDQLNNTNVTDCAWDGLKDEDILGKDIIICYSWGCAAVFKAFARLKAAGKLPFLPLLIVVAGVPNGWSQWISVAWGGGWSVPDEVGVAVCLQVNSVPTSYPFARSNHLRTNILLTGIDGNDHINVQDAAEAHQFVVNLIGNLVNQM